MAVGHDGADRVDPTAVIWSGAVVRRSRIDARASVGSDSVVERSHLGERVRIHRRNHIVGCKLGRNSLTGMQTVAMHSRIGAFCSISWGVTIGGGEHDFERVSQHSFLYDDWSGLRPEGEPAAYDRFDKPVEIGADVWIGANAIVRRGVTIGHGAVVGAGAVVTRAVPDYAIVVGSPARVVRMRFPEEIVAALLRLRWWEWSYQTLQKAFPLLGAKATPQVIDGLLSLEDPPLCNAT
jgi:acetyltransferase-like isoleucine patch superfamily enzyme